MLSCLHSLHPSHSQSQSISFSHIHLFLSFEHAKPVLILAFCLLSGNLFFPFFPLYLCIADSFPSLRSQMKILSSQKKILSLVMLKRAPFSLLFILNPICLCFLYCISLLHLFIPISNFYFYVCFHACCPSFSSSVDASSLLSSTAGHLAEMGFMLTKPVFSYPRNVATFPSIPCNSMTT